MEETFVDRCRDARRRGAAATADFLARASGDAMMNGVRERLADPPTRPAMFYWQDVRYALRLLTRSPVFTLITVLVLGGGLALGVFTFSFLHTAMLRPLPVPDGARIVRVNQVQGRSTGGIDVADLAELRPALTALTEVGAYTTRGLVLGVEGQRRILEATAADWRVFEFTRTPAAIGRTFRPGDAEPGAEPVIVLGHRAWRVTFGADSAIVGGRVVLDGAPARVIGVMPERYGFPVASEAWVPLGRDVLDVHTRGRQEVGVYARLAAGASIERAEAELALAFERLRRARPADATEEGEGVPPPRLEVQTFPMAQMGDEGPLVFAVLNLLALLILLLACVNVTNLLLARANERTRETAVRLALGASRRRLIMQSMWESVVLCVLGGALATVLAGWGLRFIDRWARTNMEANLAFWWSWGLDHTTLLAVGAFVTATLAALGGVVARRATRTNVNVVLQDGSARSGGRREGRVARALVVTQVATVSVLMFFGALSAIVAYRVANVDFGYDTHDLLSSGVELPAERYATAERRGMLFRTLHDELARSPSIEGVVLRTRLADLGDPGGAFEIGDGRTHVAGAPPRAYVQAVLGSLGTIGIELAHGRELDGRDREGSVPVAVVSRALAARHWPGRSAIGERIRLVGLGGEEEWRTVVGIVGDVLHGNPLSRDRSAEAIYVPLPQADAAWAAILFRHRGDPIAAQVALHETVAAADPLLSASTVMTFEEVLDQIGLIARSVTKLFALCFGFALLLAVTGTYGLMARSIGQRTREIGVRRALGATDATIVRLLLGQGGRQVGIGALIALPAILAVGVGFSAFVPIGVGTTVATALLVTTAIAAVVLAATYIPTRRAIGVPVRDALGGE
jgi:predicted permease